MASLVFNKQIVQTCPPIVTQLGPYKSVTVGKQPYTVSLWPSIFSIIKAIWDLQKVSILLYCINIGVVTIGRHVCNP